MSSDKPSEKFIKHGWLSQNERYNQNIHNYTRDELDNLGKMRSRNINYNTSPESQYYSNEDIDRMHSEIKTAECPICLETIAPNDITQRNCKSCEAGHKFHERCQDSGQTRITSQCPICRSTRLSNCSDNNDIFSGGKRYKKRTYKRKSNKRRTNKRRTNKRRTNKRRTNKRRTNKRRD